MVSPDSKGFYSLSFLTGSFRKFLLSPLPQLKPQGPGILLRILNSPVWCLSSFLSWWAADLAPTHAVPQPCFLIPTPIARAFCATPCNPQPMPGKPTVADSAHLGHRNKSTLAASNLREY